MVNGRILSGIWSHVLLTRLVLALFFTAICTGLAQGQHENLDQRLEEVNKLFDKKKYEEANDWLSEIWQKSIEKENWDVFSEISKLRLEALISAKNKSAIRIFLSEVKKLTEGHPETLSIYLGLLLKWSNLLDPATFTERAFVIRLLEELALTLQSSTESDTFLLIIQMKLTDLYAKGEQPEKALTAIESSLQFTKKLDQEMPLIEAFLFSKKAKLLNESDKSSEAFPMIEASNQLLNGRDSLSFFEKDIVSLLQVSPEFLFPKMQLVENLRQEARALTFLNNKEEGLEKQLRAIKMLLSLPNSVEISMERLMEFNGNKPLILKLMHEIAKMYFECYLANGQKVFLESANDYYDYYFKVSRFQFQKPKNQSLLLSLDLPFTQAVSSNFRQYRLTGEKQAFERMLNIIDLEKYYSLNKLICKSDTSHLTKSPIQFPIEFVLDSLQARIPSSEIIVNYFISESQIYIYSVGASAYEVEVVPFNEVFQDQFEEYIKSLKSANVEFNFTLAHKLHDVFLPNHLQSESFTDLVVIPHKQLWHISFEALIADLDSKDYLIESKQIRYQLSVSEYLKKPLNSEVKSSFIGYAPSEFSQPLPPLFARNIEVRSIATLLDGDYLVGAEASKKNFLDGFAHTAIVHLASHTFFDEKSPLNSRLHFQKENRSGDLYVRELFFMSASNADLMCLSASSFPKGDRSGKSIELMSYGMAKLETNNLMITMWSIPDKVIKDILFDFYREVSQGNSYKNALHRAKVKSLNQGNDLYSHPYFWSSFKLIGNGIPYAENTSVKTEFKVIIALSLLLFVVLAIFLRYSRIISLR